MLLRSTLTALLLTLAVGASGQEMLGIANSNYAGTNGVALNPASIVDSKTWLDINIVGLNAYLNNNFVYFDKNEFRFFRDVPSGNIPDPVRRTELKLRRGLVQAKVMGPSATMSFGRHAFGLHTGARAIVNLERVPQNVAVFAFEGLRYGEQQGIDYENDPFRVNALGFAEFGLSYATIAHSRGLNLVTAGLTFNYMIGIMNVSLQSEQFDYNVLNNDDLRIDHFTGETAIAGPAFNSGNGFGFDLGAQYKRLLKSSNGYSPNDPSRGCKKIDYRWKLGVSLLDLGYVNFKGATQRSYTNASTYWRNYGDFKPEGIDGVDAGLSTQFALDSALSLQLTPDANTFKAGLPSAGSVQFDYNFGYNLYTSFTYIQGFRLMKANTGMRKSLLNITPRWEHKWFEAAVPLSLHDYYQPQIGLMLRFYSLIIGSDHILALFAPVDTYGMDIYFNLKITLFDNPKCKPKKKRKKKGKKNCAAYKPDRPKPKGPAKHGFKTKKLRDEY